VHSSKKLRDIPTSGLQHIVLTNFLHTITHALSLSQTEPEDSILPTANNWRKHKNSKTVLQDTNILQLHAKLEKKTHAAILQITTPSDFYS